MTVPLRDGTPPTATAWATMALLAINLVVFLFLQPAGFQIGEGAVDDAADAGSQEANWIVADRDEFTYRWAAVPCEITSGEILASDPEGCRGERSEWLPEDKSILVGLVTAMFLHGHIAHLAGNLLFLWVFGRNVEIRLGRTTFLALYLAGGIIATLGFVAFHQRSAIPLVGASGAIAAVMGAYLVLFPRGRVLTVVPTVAFQVAYVPAVIVLLLFFASQFLPLEDDQVAWEAHAVGMAAGFLAALGLARVPAVRARARAAEEDVPLRLGSRF